MFFHPMDFLILIAFGISIWAQFKVKGTFKKFSDNVVMSGMTGYEAARRMLDANGLQQIPIEPAGGYLTDHYDPIHKVVRLSDPVYYERSTSAIAVATHEVGHAIQHKVSYPMLVWRHYMFPVVNIASGIAPILLLAGFFLQMNGLLGLGIVLFSAAVAFQLVTLPVEFNASARAKQYVLANGFVSPAEHEGVNKVLNAAALTYVAAALISLLELIKFVMIFNSSNNEE